ALAGRVLPVAASLYGRRAPPGLVTCLPGGRSKSVQPLLVFLEHEQLALPPHARERSAVDRTRAVPVEGGEMICRPVAFVLREAVLRELRVGFEHEAVARDFGDDRRGRDGGASSVTVDEIALRAWQGRQRDEVRDDQL